MNISSALVEAANNAVTEVYKAVVSPTTQTNVSSYHIKKIYDFFCFFVLFIWYEYIPFSRRKYFVLWTMNLYLKKFLI